MITSFAIEYSPFRLFVGQLRVRDLRASFGCGIAVRSNECAAAALFFL
jgi:hypothetical protein